jgi:hypothetical protein
VAVAGIANAMAILAGISSHTCALISGGDVTCLGSNKFGEVGNFPGDTDTCLFAPCALTPVTSFTGA